MAKTKPRGPRAVSRPPEVGDTVRFKSPSLDVERGTFTVRRVDATTIGRPCFLSPSPGWTSYPSDFLEVVTPTRETADQRRIRELENRVAALERKLGVRV